MALVASTGTISLANLRANLEDHRSTLTTQSTAGRKDFTIPLRCATLSDTTALSLRTVAFTPQDDMEVRTIAVRVTDTTASRVITATLSVDDGDTTFLLDKTLAASVTTINGTADSRDSSSLDLTDVTGDRVRLLKGVRYRLTLENTAAGTTTSGEVQAWVQLRTRRRGGPGGVPYMPRAFRADCNLDVDGLNDSLERARSDIQRNMDRRYTRSMLIYPFDGVTDSTNAAARAFYIRRPGTGMAVTIEAVEAVVYGNAAVGMTVTASDTAWPVLEIDTSATATEEIYGSSSVPIDVDSESVDTTLTIAWDAAYTVTRGYLVVHLLCDRGNQGDDFDAYDPTFLDATTTAVGTALDAELTAIAAAVADDGAADKDLRCECFVLRGVSSGASVDFHTPGGARRIARLDAWVVYGSGSSAETTVIVDAPSNSTTSGSSTGSPVLVTAGTDASGDAAVDPMDKADDATVSVANAGGGTALMCMGLVWWS